MMASKFYQKMAIQGFSLLEVLVALAVLAIALATVIKVTGYYAENARYLRDKTLAHWVAMNVLTDLQVKDKWLDLGNQEGTATMAGREWYWIVHVVETPDEDLRRLEVQVYYRRQDPEPVTKLEGFIANSWVPEDEMLLF
ncbi:MAG: type II secretion system minor pseudopilin GspI [Thioploca sp.]|nr:type II secretion system minor pseudopilin GspI [Thioploca sp.]